MYLLFSFLVYNALLSLGDCIEHSFELGIQLLQVYIYMCVCVCVYVWLSDEDRGVENGLGMGVMGEAKSLSTNA